MIGKTLNHYEVLDALGEGGMGEVYRAADRRLKRDVAIKVLPPELAADPERLARLEREAQMLAQLEHPNVAAVYGLEEAADPPVRFLVMQLVSGETLAHRIEQGSVAARPGGLPLQESLRIAGQIAAGLEAAHERGIVHRDLKPANVMITPDGNVKILDFGLAKALAGDELGASTELSASPTMLAATRTGMILGTAGYMSPEQARGKAVDKRTDVWAFGCVLYEMLAGRRLFDGETVSDVMASILKDEPSFDALARHYGPRLIHLLERCLVKDPGRRLRDIRDARVEIEGLLEEPEEPVAAGEPVGDVRHRRRERWAWVVAGLAVIVSLITFATSGGGPPASAPGAAFEVRLPADLELAPDPPAVSPDGTAVVFAAQEGGGLRRLWVRELDDPAPRPLEGTEDARSPFWSPDGRYIAYFVGDTLRQRAVSGGPSQQIGRVSGELIGRWSGGTWNARGDILFSGFEGRVLRVPAGGGDPVPVTEPEDGSSDRSPQFIAAGDRFLFVRLHEGDGVQESRVMLASLAGGEPTLLLDDVDGARYVEPGYLFFRREDAVLAQAFDAEVGELSGDAVVLAEGVDVDWKDAVPVDASANGVLAFNPRGARQRVVPTWFDREGRSLGAALPEGEYQVPVLSPDATRLAVHHTVEGEDDDAVWIYDLGTGIRTRLTLQGGQVPVWSPDGRRIAFGRPGAGVNFGRQLVMISSTAPGPGELGFEDDDYKTPYDWSKDGEYLLFWSPRQSGDLMALPVEGDRPPVPVAASEFSEGAGQFSPDGDWVAYFASPSGSRQLFVRAFPPTEEYFPVAAGGGTWPRWRDDGGEIYYLSDDDTIMAVTLEIDGSTVRSGVARALFKADIGGPRQRRNFFDVTGDGERFLVLTPAEGSAAQSRSLTLVTNWLDWLGR